MYFTLTNEQVNLLENNTDPAVAAVAKKLKEAVEKGEFIPKSRLNEELEQKKTLSEKLNAIETAKKLEEEDKAIKNGEINKILKTREDELITTKAQLESEKKYADAYRAYHDATMKAVKEQLGDKWSDEFSNLSMDALSKLPGVMLPKLGVDNGMGGNPPAKPTLELQLEQAIKDGRPNVEIIALKRMIMEAKK
jgi:hypothetical protein